LQACLDVQRSPLIAQPEKYGGRWQAIWQQHVNAHRRTQVIRIAVEQTGQADLTPAFNVYALTRDFVRYPNNLSSAREGYSFPEKRIADRIECPQHPQVVFHFPCLPLLSPDGGPSQRSDLEWFRTGLRIAGQKLDIEPRPARAVHLLAFNTTPERRRVKAQARILFADGRESVFPFEVPPWRQDEKTAADPLERRRLDPVLRDTEIHTANGAALNFPWAPFYMYHVALLLDSPGRVDEIYFPAADPTTAGLQDAGIGDVCIVALTLEE
ncbi:MAG: hypothetical protein N3D11_11295, partial [Candidatus Sumerlaeia bacterium]|nr:hypothetical protein [Candidatus Sumerlaeia bacterium]